MHNYELTVVLDGKATAAKKTAVTKTIEKVIELGKGKLGKVSEWGVKDLAYKIGKNTTGSYIFFTLSIEPSFVKQLDNKLKMEENIIRFLVVKE